MKYLLLIILLTSCGPALQNPVGERAIPGIHADMTLRDTLESQYKQVQECLDIHEGEFGDLAIIMMPTAFSCMDNTQTCWGEFTPPNIIKIGNQTAWKHEVVHALLQIKYGDPGADHRPEFFRCER